jgi:ribosomal protein S1
VVSTDHFGAEIELPNGLIAFMPISEIAWERLGAGLSAFAVGE